MNDESRYDVIFRGEIVSGLTSEKVRKNLIRLFKSSESTIEKLFSGKTITIKKAVTEQKAHSYQQAMQKAGAISKIRLVEDIETIDFKPVPIANDEIAEIKKQAELIDDDLPPLPAFTTEAKPEKNLHKLPSMNDDDSQFSAPPSAEITNAADPLGIAPANQWHVEDVGTRMSKPKRPFNKPLPMTDHIELSPERSDVGQAKHTVKTINADISHLDMAEVGAQLAEKSNTNIPKAPDVSHIDMADVGENMGQAVNNIEIVNQDISHYDLAETGSDMEQLKNEKELVVPDISHLDLADNTEASG